MYDDHVYAKSCPPSIQINLSVWAFLFWNRARSVFNSLSCIYWSLLRLINNLFSWTLLENQTNKNHRYPVSLSLTDSGLFLVSSPSFPYFSLLFALPLSYAFHIHFLPWVTHVLVSPDLSCISVAATPIPIYVTSNAFYLVFPPPLCVYCLS